MGAKSKPHGDALARRPRRRRRRVGPAGSRTTVLALAPPPAKGDPVKIEDDGAAAEQLVELPRREEARYERLSSSSSTTTARSRRARSASSRGAARLGGDVAGVVVGHESRRRGAGRRPTARPPSTSSTTPAFEAPLPQPRVDALEAVVAASGATNVLFAASVLSADVAAGLSARLDAGLNWDLTDFALEGGELVAQAARARRLGPRRRRLDERAADRARPLRRVRAGRDGRYRDASTLSPSRCRALLDGGADGRAGAGAGERPVDRGRRRDRRRRPRPRRARGLRARRGARRGARRSGRRDARRRRRRLVPVLDAGRADRQVGLAEALHRARHLRRDPAQGRHAELRRDRRDQQGPERADLRLRRPRRRRRPAPIVPKLTELVRARRGA